MQIHSLDLIDDYSLIGIHTSEEDYRLAYLLNLNLHTRLTRSKHNLDFKNKSASFPIFEYVDKKKQLSCFLIPNKYVSNNSSNKKENLFSKDAYFSSTAYLIREKKKVDYFLKIEGEIATVELYKIIENLNNINQIITSYKMNPSELNSKDYLIF